MNRQILLQQFSTYKACYPEESGTIDRINAFVTSEEDCFERSLSQGHITGSAWVVDRTGTQVLLTHHKKLNRWLQLGGHADGNPDVQSVAFREAEEESGLTNLRSLGTDIFDLDIHPIPARGDDPEHLHYDVRYVFQHQSDQPYTVSEESHDLGWIDIADLASVTDEESMLRMARKWQARLS